MMMLGQQPLRALAILSLASFGTPLLAAWGPITSNNNRRGGSRAPLVRLSHFGEATRPGAVLSASTEPGEESCDGSASPNLPVDSVPSRTSSSQCASSKQRRELFVGHVPAVAAASVVAALLASSSSPQAASARLEAVNRPELLPQGPSTNVIQTERVLTSGQAKRMDDVLTALERDTGYRVRVLCQRYPVTPGLAIRDYWSLGKEGQKDDKYVVLVVDDFGGKGNVLNFNVGDGVKLALPNAFWTRLQAKYGTTFYVKDNGADLAAISAIEAIATCLRSEDQYCTNVPDVSPSLRSLGL